MLQPTLPTRGTAPCRAGAILGFALLVSCAGRPHRAGPTLPTPPEGVVVREVVTFPQGEQEPVRLAGHGGRLYVLAGGGDVSIVDPQSGAMRRVLTGADYIDQPRRDYVNIPLPIDAAWVNSPIQLRATLCLGLTFDKKGRMYIVSNVQMPGKIIVNRVAIYRTAPVSDADEGIPERPDLWTRFDYPFGGGGFNHGACRIAQGPDGMIYLGSGSRTDHGEAFDEPGISKLGEAPHPEVAGGPGFPGGDFTAAILRFDPEKGQQVPEVYSRGNRNPFGFDWDNEGRLFDVENGPMADHPEELNHITQGKHYGFPYVFGNGEKPDYEDSPTPPAGLVFEPPIKNVGPGGLLGDHPLYSFAPHACPTGMVFYEAGELPARYNKSFFVGRFGNLVNYNRIGFDVLHVRIEKEGDELVARTERFLDRLGRPIDLCVADGKLYVLEYCRQTETAGAGSDGYLKRGRLLEVSGGL